jgi:predicted P-loop ATPase
VIDDPDDFENEFDTQQFGASGSSSSGPSGPARAGMDWAKDAATDGRGSPIPNLANALLCLRGAPEVSGCFGFNEMTGEVELIEELPAVRGASGASVGKLPRPVIDADVVQVVEWMQRSCRMKRISLDVVHQAVDRRGREYRFHPLRDKLDGLIWDRQPRVSQLFPAYFGAEGMEYTRRIGEMFAVSMVARVFKPGCQADHVPILVGSQGELKSSSCAVLAGEDYFGDHMPDIHHKDASQYLRGKWLIELPELAALNKGDIESWKAFITRREEKYRPPYGRKDVVEPRQCVFVGTTNQEEFLRDATGNRRFWPVQTGKIDIKALERDRAMILAEAVSMFKNKERWWPDRDFERTHIAPEQEARVVTDGWEQPITEWLDSKYNPNPTAFEIMRDALHLLTAQINPGHYRRVADIMLKLEWAQKRKDNNCTWRMSLT